jgi:hypothetical protein
MNVNLIQGNKYSCCDYLLRFDTRPALIGVSFFSFAGVDFFLFFCVRLPRSLMSTSSSSSSPPYFSINLSRKEALRSSLRFMICLARSFSSFCLLFCIFSLIASASLDSRRYFLCRRSRLGFGSLVKDLKSGTSSFLIHSSTMTWKRGSSSTTGGRK